MAKNASLHTYEAWRTYVPNYWDMQWEIFDPQCQITDLLGPRLKAFERIANNETGVPTHVSHMDISVLTSAGLSKVEAASTDITIQ